MGVTPVAGIGEAAHLGGGGFGQVGAAVSDVDAEQPGEAVQPFIAVGVVEVAAFAPLEDGEGVAVPGGGGGEVGHEVALGSFTLTAHAWHLCCWVDGSYTPVGTRRSGPPHGGDGRDERHRC